MKGSLLMTVGGLWEKLGSRGGTTWRFAPRGQ